MNIPKIFLQLTISTSLFIGSSQAAAVRGLTRAMGALTIAGARASARRAGAMIPRAVRAGDWRRTYIKFSFIAVGEEKAFVVTNSKELLNERLISLIYNEYDRDPQYKKSLATALLSKGVDINVRDGSGSTPLMLAAYRNDVVMVKFLIERGADVNAQNKSKATALYYAAWDGKGYYGNWVVEMLLDVDANPGIKDEEGRTAYDIAASYTSK